jgi:hypothetical protein
LCACQKIRQARIIALSPFRSNKQNKKEKGAPLRTHTASA